jgi:acyl-CoA thioesterase FadM
LGRSSFTLEHRLTAREGSGPSRLVATSESILVRYDYAADAPIAISAAHRAAIDAFEGRPLSG